MPSDAVLTTFITTCGGFLTVYIVQRFKNKKSNKDRVDDVISRYESYIKLVEEDNARLRADLTSKEDRINKLEGRE